MIVIIAAAESTWLPIADGSVVVIDGSAFQIHDRTGAILAGTTLQLPIAGRANTPTDATAVVLNVTDNMTGVSLTGYWWRKGRLVLPDPKYSIADKTYDK